MRAAIAIALGGLGLAMPALAQQPIDWCSQPLSVQADQGTALVWRLRCTIQVLDRERAEAMDHVTTVEIDKAVAEAHLREALDQVGALKKAKEEEEHKEPAAPPPAAAPVPPAVLPPHKDK
jgi:phage terminase Nu1 subunit (DNA packaging protein)